MRNIPLSESNVYDTHNLSRLKRRFNSIVSDRWNPGRDTTPDPLKPSRVSSEISTRYLLDNTGWTEEFIYLKPICRKYHYMHIVLYAKKFLKKNNCRQLMMDICHWSLRWRFCHLGTGLLKKKRKISLLQMGMNVRYLLNVLEVFRKCSRSAGSKK